MSERRGLRVAPLPLGVCVIKGYLAGLIDGARQTGPGPFNIDYVTGGLWPQIRSADGYTFFTLTTRGNSKQRRQFRREVLRALNAPGYSTEPRRKFGGKRIDLVWFDEVEECPKSAEPSREAYTDEDYAAQYCQGSPIAASVWRGDRR